MSVKPEGLLGDIKTANVFHHPVEAKTNLNFNTYIYILYYQLSIRFLIAHTTVHFHVILHQIRLNVILEQPERQIFAPNVLAIRDRRHDNKSKQTTSLDGF